MHTSRFIPTEKYRPWLIAACVPLLSMLALRLYHPAPHSWVLVQGGALTGTLLLLRVWYGEKLPVVRPRPLWFVLSVLATSVVFHNPQNNLMIYAVPLLAGVWCGILVFVPARAFYCRALGDKRAVVVALMANVAAPAYIILLRYVWGIMSASTAFLASSLLKLLGLKVSTLSFMQAYGAYGEEGQFRLAIIQTPYISAKIWPACCGLEGVFILFFLLSAVVLYDWRIFARWRLTELYLLGFCYMFMVNVLRITCFFLLAIAMYFMGYSNTSQYIADVFHSYVSWVVYVIAFGFFMAATYYVASREATVEALPQDKVI